MPFENCNEIEGESTNFISDLFAEFFFICFLTFISSNHVEKHTHVSIFHACISQIQLSLLLSQTDVLHEELSPTLSLYILRDSYLGLPKFLKFHLLPPKMNPWIFRILQCLLPAITTIELYSTISTNTLLHLQVRNENFDSITMT